MSARGFTVALIGCDGAGKTTVARALERDADLRARYLYMGVSTDSSNHRLPTTRLAQGLKAKRVPLPRGALRAALRLANRLAEEWYRQVRAEIDVRRGRIVVFDRHFAADFHAADVAARRRSLSRRVHGFLLTHAYPRPELVVFLDAPPEVLYARKGEGTIASLDRRRTEYLQLRRLHERFAVVDASRPLDAVLADVARIVRDHGALR